MVEFQGRTIIIEDVSEELPRHATKVWPDRTSTIKSVTAHHTGGSTKHEGLRSAKSTAEFSAGRDDPETPDLEGHSWPGIPYHFFVPYKPENRGTRLVVYRCVPDEKRTNHAGEWNNESVAVCFQGNLYSALNHLGHQPSGWQEAAWLELAPYLAERYGLDSFEFWPHAWRGKPSCPGNQVTFWLVRERQQCPTRISSDAQLREALALVLDDTGIMSDRGSFALRKAVERFQRAQLVTDAYGKKHRALKVDGSFGPATESILRRLLRHLGGLR